MNFIPKYVLPDTNMDFLEKVKLFKYMVLVMHEIEL